MASDASQPLKASVKDLKTMLEKTGHTLKGFTEKLEMLDAIARQVATKIKNGQKMKLKLSELGELLAREGFSCIDAKNTVDQLFKLRANQLTRLGSYVVAKSSDQPDLEDDLETIAKELPLMAMGKVYDVFAAELPSIKENHVDAGNSLRSSAPELKTMLEKTGHTLKGFTEKLEMLVAIARQVATKIKNGQKMNLKLSELEELLAREGLCCTGDAKNTINQLFKWRANQLTRLGSYVVAKSSDQPDLEDEVETIAKELPLMAMGKVYDVFAAELPSIKENHVDAGKSLPSSAPEMPSNREIHVDAGGSPRSESQRAVRYLSGIHVDTGDSPPRKKAKMPELRDLLEEMRDHMEILAIADVPVEPGQQADLKKVGQEAEKEVGRILAIFDVTKDVDKVLGNGSFADKGVEFRRLTKLLHPDKRLVEGDRAETALRMIFHCYKAARDRVVRFFE